MKNFFLTKSELKEYAEGALLQAMELNLLFRLSYLRFKKNADSKEEKEWWDWKIEELKEGYDCLSKTLREID
ncbi:MAG: hypothetical protein GF387_00495 [Candidatus Portnoybacteria bacterium]|nr:hypothetical protein [Candidatus Portnoybacteria bacterium]